MKTPKDIFDLLRLNDLKKQSFFIREYQNDEYAVKFGNKVLYCSAENECKKFSAMNVLIKIANEIELYEDHLEADARVEFHAKHAHEANPENIVIRSNDTHIVVTLRTNAQRFSIHIVIVV